VAAYCNSVSGKNWVHFIAYDAEKSDTTSEISLLENLERECQSDRISPIYTILMQHMKDKIAHAASDAHICCLFLVKFFCFCSQPNTIHERGKLVNEIYLARR
jgi:hypothetical protein